MPDPTQPTTATGAMPGPVTQAAPGTLDLAGLLRFSVAQGISDIHLKPGRPPIFRRGNSAELVGPKGSANLESQEVLDLFNSIMDVRHHEILRERGNVDLGFGVTGMGRLRINLFRSRSGYQAVLRVILARVPKFKDLGLPRVFDWIADQRRGLVLVTGATGQGKTTTLASMADHINRTRSCHIVTIEDPIEFVIEDRRAVVTQREVLTDTPGFEAGLRAALRQDPDVIIVGEMRDRETVETALKAAETGHLVLSTLHTLDVRETVNRIVGFFREGEQDQAREMLAAVICAICSQRLVPRADGSGRVPAVEVAIGTGRIRDLLRKPDGLAELPNAMAQGTTQYGMQTFDQSLMSLYKAGQITYEEALLHCSNPSDFALRVRGIASGEEDSFQGGREPEF